MYPYCIERYSQLKQKFQFQMLAETQIISQTEKFG